MNLEARKYNLISKITHIQNEVDIARLEVVFKNIEGKSELLKKLAKPMRKKLDVNELVKEQGFKGVDRQKFDAIIKELDIKEPIEKLIAAI